MAGHRAPTPHRALEWLKRQATRLADRIDPDPADAPWAPVSVLRPVGGDQSHGATADPATALRRWTGDAAELEQVLRMLRDGSLYTFTTADGHLRYRLSARAVLAAASHRRQEQGGAA